ncbi:hypothetical protein [Rickettsia endosymbiont of Rhinocyllus conicus]|uniref:hypothetical protein n=1 Tax=Rickettsia endosymbiont of Rhinocyllus conicus TaxID=3066252 RepID=UPI003132D831
MMLTHHGAHGKLKLFHLEDGGFNHQRDYKSSGIKPFTGIIEKLVSFINILLSSENLGIRSLQIFSFSIPSTNFVCSSVF